MTNTTATLRTDHLIESTLKQRATFHHTTTQKLKIRTRTKNKPELLKKTQQKYLATTKTYKQYLNKYPNQKNLLKIMFLHTKALFYTNKFIRTTKTYTKIRNHKISKNKYKNSTNYSTIKTIKNIITNLIKQHKIHPKITNKKTINLPEPKNTNKHETKIYHTKPKKLPTITTT